jgi:hypothetical protein
LHEQVTAEMDSRTSAMDARLRQVEGDEANQRAQLLRCHVHSRLATRRRHFETSRRQPRRLCDASDFRSVEAALRAHFAE